MFSMLRPVFMDDSGRSPPPGATGSSYPCQRQHRRRNFPALDWPIHSIWAANRALNRCRNAANVEEVEAQTRFCVRPQYSRVSCAGDIAEPFPLFAMSIGCRTAARPGTPNRCRGVARATQHRRGDGDNLIGTGAPARTTNPQCSLSPRPPPIQICEINLSLTFGPADGCRLVRGRNKSWKLC